MRLNIRNFLSWHGSFPETPAINLAITESEYFCAYSEAWLDCNILASDTATFGIDNSTIEVVPISHSDFQYTWVPNTQMLRAFRLLSYTGDVVIFKYRWKDNFGNYSNWALEKVEFEA